MTTVRMATPADFDGVMNLCRLMYAEGGYDQWDEEKVRQAVRRGCVDKQSLIGVIDSAEGPAAVIILELAQPWYSSEWFLSDAMNFVHPDYRRSDFAKSLIKYARHLSDNLNVPLRLGVVSNVRTEAKCKMIGRHLTKVGEFFEHRPGAV